MITAKDEHYSLVLLLRCAAISFFSSSGIFAKRPAWLDIRSIGCSLVAHCAAAQH